MAKKKIGPDHQLAAHIPFYRTRKFWGVVLILPLIFSIIIFVLSLDKHGSDMTYSLSQILDKFNIAFGGTFFYLFGYKIGSFVGAIIGALFYYCAILYLLVKTFSDKKVGLHSPTLILLFYILGIVTSIMFMGGV